ncbi:tail fiber protein [Sphingomonas sp. HITSZ_GF]|uniref:phage tail protein n=1 Tax=Sphingomonas sp. HITSZ_GF TaxID=3037247 RepID=UPI00240E0C89|nr:tail fiber protein [Sphingomonas sp. HITSZ_GF]MDG2535817.1 tail fiber protein [Sphingomonas sp. HITSZ_GF]
MDYFMGQIMQVGFSFAPRGWFTCQGQILSISQNTALFSLLGTTFGGDGVQTFKLPDAQGRALIGVGNGPGLPPTSWGEIGGTPSVTLNPLQMPIHNHGAIFTPQGGGAISVTPTLQATVLGRGAAASETAAPAAGATLGIAADTSSVGTSPVLYVPAGTTGGAAVNLGGISCTATGGLTGGSVTVQNAGGSQPFSIMQPYLAVMTCICSAGVFPSRN